MSTAKLNQNHIQFRGSLCELRVSSLLKNHKSSAAMLLDDVYQLFAHVNQINPRFPFYTISLFYDPVQWCEFTRGYRIALGLCVAFLVKRQLISFKRVNPNKSGTAKYQIIDSFR